LTLLTITLPFWLMVAAVVALGIAFVMALDAIVGWFDEVGDAFKDVSFADAVEGITDGIIKAVEDSASKVWESFKNLAKGGLDAFKSALGIKSPSLAFRLAGREIPRGAALGVEDEAPALQASAAAMVSPDDMGGTIGGKSGNGQGGGSRVYHIQINVASSDELLDESWGRRFMRSLDAAAREGGLSPEPEAV
jgi:hypothetical protein